MGSERIELGRRGEALAETFLTDRGYEIVEKNFRCRTGELDLIAKEGGSLVFIEVRTKSSTAFGSPLESVTFKKREKIRKLAELYIHMKKMYDIDCRFDIVSVMKKGDSLEVELLQDAF